MQNYTTINSKLYATLFEEGGDALIAVYAKLKSAKRINGRIFKEQNRNIYHTLKTETNLSISTLRKYIKVLIKLNLCSFDSQGNFYLVGGNKINKQFKTRKYVRVEIGTFAQTKLFSFRVRIYTIERLQKKALERKYKLKNIIARMDKGFFISKQELNFLKRCKAKGQTTENYNAKIVLSNQGYSKLKHGEERSKSSGNYWKKKLVKANLIQVKRQFKYLRKGTLSDYLQNREFDRTIVYKNGKIFKELIPTFSTTIEEPKQKINKLEYLSFDFIYWSNNR
jgi:hypothetical protein